jgi:DNA-binding Xre family transcriptional regulator
MRYRVTHLWDVLKAQERSLAWLSRKTGYSTQYLSLLKKGQRERVSAAFVSAVCTALGLPLSALFMPVNSTEVDEIVTQVEVA